MTIRPLSFLIAAAWLAAVPAQAATHDGKWTMKFTASNGKEGEATVHLAGDAGTFKYAAIHTRNIDPCHGLQAPVQVKAGGDGKLVLLVDYASILKDCRNLTLNLQAVDERTLKGTSGRTLPVVLTRD